MTFEQTQKDVEEIKKGILRLEASLLNNIKPQAEIETPLNIKEVSKLIKKTVPTIYSYCQRNLIPHAKQGNRLIFFESEIIAWLKSGKIKTNEEMEAEATNYVSNHKKAVIKRENLHYNGSEVDNSIIKLNK
jgi:predicted DNA-binding transcriptional regulator AlpA